MRNKAARKSAIMLRERLLKACLLRFADSQTARRNRWYSPREVVCFCRLTFVHRPPRFADRGYARLSPPQFDVWYRPLIFLPHPLCILFPQVRARALFPRKGYPHIDFGGLKDRGGSFHPALQQGQSAFRPQKCFRGISLQNPWLSFRLNPQC